jgi:hypothetical protein
VFNLQEDELRVYEPRREETPWRLSGAILSGPCARPFLTDRQEETAILQSTPAGRGCPDPRSTGERDRQRHLDLTRFGGVRPAICVNGALRRAIRSCVSH